MTELRSRRQSTQRSRRSAIVRKFELEALEPRIVLDGNGLIDPVSGVPVEARFAGAHGFRVTGIPEDSNNDGVIGSAFVTFNGTAGLPAGDPGGTGHGTLSIIANQGGSEIGREDIPASSEALITFSFMNTTALVSGDPITFQVQSAFGTVPVLRVDDNTPLTGTFTIDTTGPTITSIGPIVTDDVTNTLSTVDVTFSEPIDLRTFSSADLSLTYNGTPVSLANPVRLTFPSSDPDPISPTNTIQIAGFRLPTSRAGDYRLTVDASAVSDAVGNAGSGSSFVDFGTNLPPANGVVGVSGLLSTASHDFLITQIPQDLDNNGRINSQVVEFVGIIERTNRDAFTDTHTDISMKPIVNGVVQDDQVLTFGTADFDVDPTAPYRANFRFPVTLDLPPSTVPHTETVAFQVIVESRGTLNALLSSDFIATPSVSTNLTATLTLDAGPTISSIGPISSPRNTPVSTVDVTFSEAIDGTTFTAADLALTLNGLPVDVSAATFTPIDPTTFQIGNLSAATTPEGSYVLTVDASQINDLLGNPGSGSESVAFVVDTTAPTINALAPIPKSQSPTASIPVSFSEPIDPATFGLSNLSLRLDGVTVPLTAPPVAIATTTNQDFIVSGLESFTSTPGTYVFSVSRTGITDVAGNVAGGRNQSVTFVLAAAPFIANIGPLPAPSTGAIDAIDVTFSNPINPATFTTSAIGLTLVDWATADETGVSPNDTVIPLPAGVTITPVTDTVYRISGLGLTQPANYSITVDSSSITDPNGVPFEQGSVTYPFSITPGNGVVGVAAVFKSSPTTTNPHHVLITSINEDANNNGYVNSQTVTLNGDIWRPDEGDFTDTHSTIIIQATLRDRFGNPVGNPQQIVWEDTSVPDPEGQFEVPASDPSHLLFTFPIQLADVPTAQQVTFLVNITRSGTPNQIADFLYWQDSLQVDPSANHPLTATFILDTTAPVLDPLPPVQSPRTTPVESVEVSFQTPIDPTTFGPEDLILTRNGQQVPLGPEVTVTLSDTDDTNTEFTIRGLGNATTPPGDYVLTVNAAGVSDLAGNAGVGTQPLSFSVVQVVSGPQIVNLQRFGYHFQSTMLVLTFDRGLDPATAKNPNNYQVFAPGRDHRIGTADDVLVPVSSLVYDPTSLTVTLVMAQRLSIFQTNQLIVSGTGESAITDTNGNVLDGDGDGTAGGDYVQNFGREILAGSARIQRSVLKARRLPLHVFTPVPKPLNPFAQRLARRRAMLKARG